MPQSPKIAVSSVDEEDFDQNQEYNFADKVVEMSMGVAVSHPMLELSSGLSSRRSNNNNNLSAKSITFHYFQRNQSHLLSFSDLFGFFAWR